MRKMFLFSVESCLWYRINKFVHGIVDINYIILYSEVFYIICIKISTYIIDKFKEFVRIETK